MDILAHGLWIYAVSKAKKNPLLVRWQVFFGIFPDLVWLPATAFWLVTTGMVRFSMPLYDVSHSLVVWAAVTLVAMLYYRRAYLLTWPWALHIAIDIPGHTDLQTPFLWPLSDFTVRGWFDWMSAPWLTANYAVLAFVIAGIALRKRDKLEQ